MSGYDTSTKKVSSSIEMVIPEMVLVLAILYLAILHTNFDPRVRKGQVRSGQVRSGQVRSGQVRSGQVRSGQVRSGLNIRVHLRLCGSMFENYRKIKRILRPYLWKTCIECSRSIFKCLRAFFDYL
jgi:hypothetical protein